MANPSERIEFYGEDCLDRFLSLILHEKMFKGCAFLARNSGGYDSQLVSRWIKHHRQNARIIREHEYEMVAILQGYDLGTLSNIMQDRYISFGGHMNVF
jgi:hypothetical protein